MCRDAVRWEVLAAVEASSVELLVVALRKSLPGMTEMKGDCPESSMHERLH